MDSNRQHDDDLRLDHLLGEARWPEPDEERIQRLRDQWRVLSRRQQRYYGVVTAIAASVLVAAGVVYWRVTRLPNDALPAGGDRPIVAVPPPAKNQPDALPSTHEQPRAVIARRVAVEPVELEIEVKNPNLYQQVVMLGISQQARLHEARPLRPKPPPVADRQAVLQKLLAALQDDPNADVAADLAIVQADMAWCEAALADEIRRPEATSRVGAARLLARIGTERSLPLLNEQLGDPAVHEAAAMGIARLAPPQAVARLAVAEKVPALREQLLASLLARGTPDAVETYLNLVRDPTTRAAALSAADLAARPPVDLLFAYLESPQTTLRLPAAQTLGQIDGPEVARRLWERVSGSSRQEALVALLMCGSPESNNLLRRARADLYLVASVQAAEQQLFTLSDFQAR